MYALFALTALAGCDVFTDTTDLEQFAYLSLLNPRFDENPVIRRTIEQTKDKLGAFGAAMRGLPDSVVEEIKRDSGEDSASGGGKS
ncbi:hypothetical protein R20943_06122 [Paraburkholderia aspalathi]|nr:hypothetical protein R20943_06122 [Paraburkholderia aspalathi]